MKKLAVFFSVLALFVLALGAASANADLAAGEKKVLEEQFASEIPKDKIITMEQFYPIWQKAMGDKAYRDKIYMLDVRSHPEYYAFHIQGTDHVHSGHMYTIPKLIPDPNAEIYVFCRTAVRSQYVAGFLYKYGYKNVTWVKGGVVEWAKLGHEFVNQFMGKLKITEYHKEFGMDKDVYRLREFHPY